MTSRTCDRVVPAIGARRRNLPVAAWFIERFAPDPSRPRFAGSHATKRAVASESPIFDTSTPILPFAKLLGNAVRRRHEMLRHTAGLNAEVFDSLVLMAAGSWEPVDVAGGHDHVTTLIQDMHAGRSKRLIHLGFTDNEAAELSSLHTRNFM